jgi:hypothetical protein
MVEMSSQRESETDLHPKMWFGVKIDETAGQGIYGGDGGIDKLGHLSKI